MKRILLTILALLCLCFTLTACNGNNYPGEVKAKYWVSEDKQIVFWFPAEAGHGNAQGYYKSGEDTTLGLILEWDTKSGIVEVKTASYDKVFTANTTTNASELTCTFEITSQESGYDFPTKIVFIWNQNITNLSKSH